MRLGPFLDNRAASGTHLNVGLQEIKDGVPVRAAQALQARDQAFEDLNEVHMRSFIHVEIFRIVRKPLLNRLNEEDGPVRREQLALRCARRSDCSEQAQER